MNALPKTFEQRICEARGCTPDEALAILARELRTPSQRFWAALLKPWCGLREAHYREVVGDFSRCRHLTEVKNSVVYWRQRTPESGFLGDQFRVHTSQAMALFERFSGSPGN